MSFVAKAGGFLLIPLAGALVLRKIVDPTKDTVAKAAYKGAAAHAAIAAAAYYASDHVRSNALSEFLTGGMWSSGIGAGLLAVTPQFDPEESKKLLADSQYKYLAQPFSPINPARPVATAGLPGKSGAATIVSMLTGHGR